MKTVTKWRKWIGLTTALFLFSILITVATGYGQVLGVGVILVLSVLILIVTDFLVNEADNPGGDAPKRADDAGTWPELDAKRGEGNEDA